MLKLPASTKIYLCSQPIDMRLSFDALSGLVQTQIGQNPLCGHLFVFFSRRRDRMKVLFWHLDGFVLYYKRLERGTFSWLCDTIAGDNPEISSAEFSLLLEGINPLRMKSRSRIGSAQQASLV